MDVKEKENDENGVQLKRSIGLPTGCSIIIGSIIGSGIFVTPQGVLLGAGSYGMSLIIWTMCGMLSMCGSLAYAEVGLLIPKSGSAYYYLKEIYGDCAAFVFMFSSLFCVLPGGTAAVALTCAEYLLALFFNDGCGSPPEDIKKMVAVCLILFGAIVNARSVNLASNVTVFFTVAKVAALAVIIIGGLVKISQGFSDYLHPDNSFQGTNSNLGGIATALLSGMWAYGGWEALNFTTEELKEPAKNLPKAVFISIPLVTVVYILTNVSYFAVMTPEEIKESVTVALTWAEYVIPNVFWFVPLAVTLSTFAGTCIGGLTNVKLMFVAAREGHLPDIISMIHVDYFTPAPAVIFFSTIVVAFVFMGTIGELIQFTSILSWVFHFLVGLGVLILRYTKKDVHRDYKAPLICPIVLMLFSLFLFFGPIIGNPQWGNFFAIFVIILAITLWLFFVRWSYHLPGIGLITQNLQLFLKSAPSEDYKTVEGSSQVIENGISHNTKYSDENANGVIHRGHGRHEQPRQYSSGHEITKF